MLYDRTDILCGKLTHEPISRRVSELLIQTSIYKSSSHIHVWLMANSNFCTDLLRFVNLCEVSVFWRDPRVVPGVVGGKKLNRVAIDVVDSSIDSNTEFYSWILVYCAFGDCILCIVVIVRFA